MSLMKYYLLENKCIYTNLSPVGGAMKRVEFSTLFSFTGKCDIFEFIFNWLQIALKDDLYCYN